MLPSRFDQCYSLLVTHKNESNKIAQTIWHCFPVQFLVLLHVMCFVLLSVLPIKTDYLRDADWLLKYPTNQQKGYEKLTQTTKRSTPPERALKTKLETRVRLFVLFCLTHFFVWQVVHRRKKQGIMIWGKIQLFYDTCREEKNGATFLATFSALKQCGLRKDNIGVCR